MDLIKDKYYQLKGIEGFGCALANAMVEFGEHNLARQVYETFGDYQYTCKGGEIIDFLTPRAVADLTSGQYKGQLEGNYLLGELDQNIRANFGDEAESLLKIIKEDIEDGLIQITEEIEYDVPAVLIVESNFYFEAMEGGFRIFYTDEPSYRYIVRTDFGYVYDGLPVELKDDFVEHENVTFETIAVLKIERNPNNTQNFSIFLIQWYEWVMLISKIYGLERSSIDDVQLRPKERKIKQ